jgi:hypothetical protein
MYKPQELKINSFSGGIADGSRSTVANQFQIAKHFDIFSDPNRLIPYRSLEADTNDGSTATGMKQYAVKDFLYASGSAKLYGLGQTGAGLTKIAFKADATTGNWTLPASSEGNGAVKNGCLVEYKDYLWGFQGTNQVWKWGTLSGTPSITNSVSTTGVTITSVANGVIASDDNLYLPYNNKIGRVTSGGTYNDAVLTLPSNFKITSLTNYGKYLAIACAPISSYNGVSKVFLWNLTSSDIQEAIDWGEGELRIIETIEGYLVGVTDRYLNNDTGVGKGSMIVQIYSGGTPQVVKEVFTSKLTGVAMPISKAVKNNRLFFAAKIMTNTTGTEYNEGIWSFGRKNASYPFALNLDIICEEITTSGIQGFGTAANYFFVAHSADGSISKTNDASTFAYTSIYETQIFDGEDPAKTKQIQKLTVTTAPISAGSITLKYKVDGGTSWATIGSYSTVGGVGHDFLNIESSGEAFKSFGEVKFRLESTGGVEITSFRLMYQTLIGSNN